jgi:hypothetical protein
MEPTNLTFLAFYQLLGRVFYATAQADNEIHEKEIETMKQVVKDHWLALEDSLDEFGSDAAFQIEIVFDHLLENDQVVGESVLDELEEFKSSHPSLFTPEVGKMIMDTSSKIASAFAKRNKSESVFLSQLFLTLKND